MAKELKPCPFCGGKARPFSYYDGITFYGVQCTKCLKANIDGCFTEKEARNAWNRRASDD